MKKFLFTLLALFMASTAFATNEYFYMDDIQVTKSFLAQTGSKARDADIPVKAHFEARVSAWQVDLTLPEGVTLRNAKAGSDMTLHTLDAVGNDKAIPVEVNAQTAVNRIIVANAIKGYYYPEGADPDDDPVTCGAAKWEAGEYEMMMIITLRFSQDFTGGEITVQTAPSSGQDPRGGITDGLTRTSKCQVTVVDDETFSIDPTEASAKVGETINVTATVSASDATLSYTGATVTATAAGFDITSEEAGVFTVTATATIGEEKTFDSSKWTIRNSKNYVYLPLTAEGTYTFEEEVQPKDLNGTINISDPDEDGKVTVTYTPGEGDPENVELAVVVKDKDGKVVEATFENGVLQLLTYGEYTVTVTASATGYNDKNFDPETVTWNKKAVAAPVIDYTTYDTEVVVTITWPTSDGEKMYTGEYTYPRTNEDQSFVVEAYVTEGETCQESAHATETIPVPKKEVIAKPTITFSGEETTTMTVTVEAAEGCTLIVNGEAINSNTYTYTVTRADVYTAGTVNVTAVAKKGDLESETATGSKDWVVQKKDADMPTIEGKVREGSKKYFDIIITPDANTDGALKYTADPMGTVLGAKAEPVTIQYERGNEDYYVDVTAYTEGTATYNQSETAEARIKVPKLDQVEEPEINYVVDGDKITVTATCDTEGSTVVLVGPDGTEYPSGTATVTFDPYQGYDETWTATASADDMLDNSATQEIKIDAKKVYNVPDPTITVDNSDPTKTVITIEATEGDLTYNIDAEEGVVYTVEEVDGKVIITVVNGDETAFVTVTATTTMTTPPAGYDEVKNGEAEQPVEIPAKPEQTAAPTIDVSFGGEDGAHYANVTFVNNDTKPAVIEYSLDNGKTWNTYTPGVPVVINTYGETTVLARAKAEGKTVSENAERSFTLNDDATSVNELVNGKTVAGVRYFNMAGQEMQEANGITIVVTTYTDGTTSAVKVIK